MWTKKTKSKTVDLCHRGSHFGVVKHQNRILKMAELCPFKVGVKVQSSWPILGQKIIILATFLRYGLQICTALHCQTKLGQTKLEVNWT